ncbi:MAG: M3 family oligoendopeptidase [Anaerolineae bacterium]|nr:M3 family oligoendopeptidase [Anaerolineae bacterium]
MFNTLPKTAHEFMDWDWPQIEPYLNDLLNRELTAENVADWLVDWSILDRLFSETYARLSIATTLDTTDKAAVEKFHHFLQHVIEPASAANNNLKQKLLASGLNPVGFEIPLRNMRQEAEIFREENIPLATEERKLADEYNRIVGAQTVQWEGEEKTLTQLKPIFQNGNRPTREKAWRLINERRLQDREALNALWVKLLDLRVQMAKNAGFDNFRDLRWKQFMRFDYTPQDCKDFHAAIEEIVVPAATRIYERQRQMLGVDKLRPWDVDRDDVYPPSRPALTPFETVEELVSKAENIFRKVDPELGDYFGMMRRENLLDLDNRKGKAPGGYQSGLAMVKRPFIFMNAVGIHDDVNTLLHEGGHAFHLLEAVKLPYSQQWEYGSEIAEVASMSMELLGAPYLTAKEGGYYSDSDAAHARIHHLEHILLFWPFMAVVDAFQHWVYENADAARNPANCDAKWGELWSRFIPGVDWNDFDAARMTGWHRKLHIFQIPFYYVDYGLAQVGALQVWRNSLQDQVQAVKQYRYALSLGGTRTLPELYAAAGAKLAFDAGTMQELVDLIEGTIDELHAAI